MWLFRSLPCAVILLLHGLTRTFGASGTTSSRTYMRGGMDHRSLAASAWTVITKDTFENKKWGNFQDGGNDVKLLKRKKLLGGKWVAEIRDDSRHHSSLTHEVPQDVTSYQDCRVNFRYYAKGMEANKAFVLEFASNQDSYTEWHTLHRYVSGTDFANKVKKWSSIVFSDAGFDVSTMTGIQLRFRADGGNNSDRIWLDNVSFEGLPLQDVCPVNRQYPFDRYSILPYEDDQPGDAVEDDLAEISSLVFTSHTDAQGRLYAYVVSDKEQFSIKVLRFDNDPPSPSAWTGTAETVATYTLAVSSTNDDWEDLSLGPCASDSDIVCIYVGNFGNNDRGGSSYTQRDELVIFKFPEPYFDDASPPVDATYDVVQIVYRYATPFEQGRFFDDWTGVPKQGGAGKGDIYIVTKGDCGSGVGRIPASVHESAVVGSTVQYDMTPVLIDPPQQGSYTCSDGPFRPWQGADMRRSGNLIALIVGGSPARVYFFARLADQTVTQALQGANCPYIASTSYGLENEKKHDAVAFTAEGSQYADVSECQGGKACHVPLTLYQLLEEAPTVNAPTSGWTQVSSDDFEGSDHWGSFTGGSTSVDNPEVYPTEDSACHEGWSIQLHLNGVASSLYHATDQDASLYTWLRIRFDFGLDGFDHLDTFYLELSLDSGATYHVLEDWSLDVHGIVDGSCESTTVAVSSESLGVATFGNGVRLRFRSSANARNDRAYIDNVVMEGNMGGLG